MISRKRQRRRLLLQGKVLSRLLRTVRTEADLTQDQLGYLLGRDQSFIAKLESGKRALDLATGEQIAEACQKPLAVFETLSEIDRQHPELKMSVEQSKSLLSLHEQITAKTRARSGKQSRSESRIRSEGARHK